MTRTRYWWPTATTEQKLHQVKHAIEARLTQGETAIFLGATTSMVAGFAKKHGLDFSNSDRSWGIRRAAKTGMNSAAARITKWRSYGFDNEYIADRIADHIDYRRTNDDDVQELRFTE